MELFNILTIIIVLSKLFSFAIQCIKDYKFDLKEYLYIIYDHLNCQTCLSFWLTILIYKNLLIASQVYIIISIINYLINKYENYN
jgi:hypothetical protein